MLKNLASESTNKVFIEREIESLEKAFEPVRKDILSVVRKCLRLALSDKTRSKSNLSDWIQQQIGINNQRYSSLLYSESKKSAFHHPRQTRQRQSW